MIPIDRETMGIFYMFSQAWGFYRYQIESNLLPDLNASIHSFIKISWLDPMILDLKKKMVMWFNFLTSQKRNQGAESLNNWITFIFSQLYH